MNKFKYIFSLFLILICLFTSGSTIQPDTTEAVKFYSLQTGVYIVDIDTEKCPNCIQSYISDSLETVESVAEKTEATAAINTGFFDPSNAKTTSYIIKDGELVADPTLNANLMDNPALKEYLPSILNRSEFRILDCTLNVGKQVRLYQIAQHNEPVQMKCEITDSIQAGPELVPDLKLSEEAFVVTKDNKVVKESAGALGKYARSAIGIKDKHILLVAVSNANPMTIKSLALLMKSLEVDQAMAFDGGSSTSLYVNLPNCPKFVLTSAKDNAARKVKSVLLIKNAASTRQD